VLYMQVMHYDSMTNYHWAMSDPVLNRPDIDRKFGMFTYNKVDIINKDNNFDINFMKIFLVFSYVSLIKLRILYPLPDTNNY
jgi:hypothetical protein